MFPLYCLESELKNLMNIRKERDYRVIAVFGFDTFLGKPILETSTLSDVR